MHASYCIFAGVGALINLENGERFVLKANVHVGREAGMDICCRSAHVSGLHATLRWTGDRWAVIDLSSRNGTWVDGNPVVPGQLTTLVRGSKLGVGDPEPTWRLECDGPPGVMAVPVAGGSPVTAEGGMIGIPNGRGGVVALVRRGAGWYLEADQDCIAVEDGQLFDVFGRTYRFACQESVTRTATAPGSITDASCSMRFRVSRDEEHVELAVMRNDSWHSLGSRSCFYLGLTLARKRLREPELADGDQGWLRVHELLRMVPDYGNEQHLSVDVHRFRRCLASAGVTNAPRLIERRRGEIRLGTRRVVVQSM